MLLFQDNLFLCSNRWSKGGIPIPEAKGDSLEVTVDYSYFTDPVSCEVSNSVGSTNVSTLVDVQCMCAYSKHFVTLNVLANASACTCDALQLSSWLLLMLKLKFTAIDNCNSDVSRLNITTDFGVNDAQALLTAHVHPGRCSPVFSGDLVIRDTWFVL